ncbi:MAG: hypothetical protein P8N26_02630 [Cyclobacteriaceae bacterium]|nr:hypothetical protein [Cyclobacteriaceae bacterium]
MVRSREEKSIGLALSGGGYRSVAHCERVSFQSDCRKQCVCHHWRAVLSRYHAQRNFENPE